MDLRRTAAAIDFYTRHYNENGLEFSVRHGTYTTVIEGPFGKQKFLTHKFGNRVFAAANMIKKDVLESAKAREIMTRQHKKDNYSNTNRFTNLLVETAKNIDINSAYASCLYINDLISEKTFNYIKGLKKPERLPCVGMLAKGYVNFKYADGVCVETTSFREPTAQIFYYLISEVNYLMSDIEFELGNKFIFYWVDGIFFQNDTNKKKIRTVEEMIMELGYGFKYEDVRDLRYIKAGDKYVVEMIKNKDRKRYEFADVSPAREITRNLYNYARETQNRRGVPEIDIEPASIDARPSNGLFGFN